MMLVIPRWTGRIGEGIHAAGLAMLLTAGVTAGVIAPASNASAASPGEGAVGDPPEGYVAAVADAAAEALAAEIGLSDTEARQRLDSQAQRQALGTLLTGELGVRAAGFFLDQENDAVVVNVLDEEAAVAVQEAGAVPKLVSRNWAGLTAAQDRLVAHAVVNTAIGMDVVANQVVLTVSSAVSGEELAGLLAEAESLGPTVRVEYVSGLFEMFLKGGDAIYGGGSRCSAGFNVTLGGVLTAGHCTAQISSWTVAGGGYLGPAINASFPGNDYGRIRNDGGVSQPGHINLYNGSFQRVTGSGNPAVNQAVCKSGSTTSLTCGTVQFLNVTVTYPQGTVSGLAQSNACAAGGDSGGSWFAGSTALGLTSGGRVGQCSPTFFQPVEEALSAYGVALVIAVPPPNPTNLAAQLVCSTNVDLTWSGTNAELFKIERRIGSSSFQEIATRTTASFSDTNVSPSNTYSYRVRAYSAAGGDSGYSNVVAVTTPQEPSVSNISVNPASVGQGQAQAVSWTSANQRWYGLYLYNSAGTAPVNTTQWGGGTDGRIRIDNPSTIQSTTWTVFPNLPGGTYRLRVVVGDACVFVVGQFSPQFNVVGATVGWSQPTGQDPEDGPPVRPYIYLSTTSNWNIAAPITFSYKTKNLTALAGFDYGAITNATMSIPAGTPPGAYPVPTGIPMVNDSISELNETLEVELFNLLGANQGLLKHTLTILDDEPRLRFGDAERTVYENSGIVQPQLQMSKNGAGLSAPLAVRYRAVAVGGSLPGEDFLPLDTTVMIPRGSTSYTASINPGLTIVNDSRPELDEQVNIEIVPQAGVGLDPPSVHKVYIINDDTQTMSVSDTDADEVTPSMSFTVTLSRAVADPVTVDYVTGSGTATAGADFQARSGTVTFMPGASLTQFVAIPIIFDNIDEEDEQFYLRILNPVNVTIADDEAFATIRDDDPPPVMTIDDATLTLEGKTGSTNLPFMVRISPASGKTVTVNYAAASDSAVAGTDFTAVTGPLTFAPGVTALPVNVPVLGDLVDEVRERFFVNLSIPGNTTLVKSQAIGMIWDDDPEVCKPIATLPFVITAQGRYCLTRNLSTGITTGAAISINVDFVELDLNSFKIGGGSAGFATQAVGVYALNRKNITVKNGNIRGFLRAVFLEDTNGSSQGHLVSGLRVDENTLAGIHVQGRGNTVRDNQVVLTTGTTVFGTDADTYGIRIDGPSSRALNNDVSDTIGMGARSGYGIYVTGADGMTIERNRISNALPGSKTAIRVWSGNAFLAVGNRMTNADFGIDMTGATGRYRDNLTSGVATPYVGGTDVGNNN